ncbi:MAG: hypothetical protein R3E99_02630 [Burkholderiaceae bacterium]
MAAHALWVGAALVVAVRRVRARSASVPGTPVPGWPVAGGAIAAALVPDLVHMLPVTWWALTDGAWRDLIGYGLATPGQEPDMPLWVGLASHHLHCVFHSGLVAGTVHLLLLWRYRARAGDARVSDILPRFVAWPLYAWWSHILIDVISHSDDFYPSPVLYPLTYAGLDGFAWNQPAFMVLNYLALGLTWAWLFRPGRPS